MSVNIGYDLIEYQKFDIIDDLGEVLNLDEKTLNDEDEDEKLKEEEKIKEDLNQMNNAFSNESMI